MKEICLPVFYFCGVLFFSRSFTFIFEALPGQISSIVFFFICSFFYIVSSVIVYFYLKKNKLILTVVSRCKYPLIICGCAICSSAFSDYSGESFESSLALFGSCIFSIALVSYVDANRLVYLIVHPLLGSLLASIIVALFLPSVGIDDGTQNPSHAGLWQGVFGFKNNLGRISAIVLLLMLYCELYGSRVRRIFWLIPLICLVMSRSTTPLIGVLFVFFLVWCVFIFKRSTKVTKILLLPILFCISLLMGALFQYVIFDIFNKDLSGSGRSFMWESIFLGIDYRIFGYGFGGVFWGEGRPAQLIFGRFFYDLGHAHNGIVDAVIDMGYVGLFLYPISLVHPLIGSIKRLYLGQSAYGLTLIITSFLIVYSVSGSSYIKQNNLLFIMYCFSIYYPYWCKFNEVNHGSR